MNKTQEFAKKHNIPILGFGCMRLPATTGAIDIEETIAMVDAYMEAGYNYFDTAYGYHDGKSELAVKEAITKRYKREDYLLVDKLPIWNVNKKEDVEKIFNDQLEKCGVDYFDIYLLHAIDGEKNEKHVEMGSYEFLKKMREQGKIKIPGFSYHGNTEDLGTIMEQYHSHFDIVQLQLNYFDWAKGWAKDQFEIIKKYEKPVITMEPVRGGMLSRLPENIGNILKEANPNVSQASWAIRWLLNLPEVVNVLSGMSNLEQVEDNIKTIKKMKPLSEEELKVVDTVAKKLLEMSRVPCTECDYCSRCPVEIPIAKILMMYNGFLETRSMYTFTTSYKAIDKNKNAAACTDCGICVDDCPQSVNVPEKMKEIAILLES
ncbi:MAG: aldo/keto reductase [Defluviitaleaceae bacterium]|nr:aldo/keto reductase [Defluviitaleaceae bacterium]